MTGPSGDAFVLPTRIAGFGGKVLGRAQEVLAADRCGLRVIRGEPDRRRLRAVRRHGGVPVAAGRKTFQSPAKSPCPLLKKAR